MLAIFEDRLNRSVDVKATGVTDIVYALLLAYNTIKLVICIWNIAFLQSTRRIRLLEGEEGQPKVSVLIPARNEESNIGTCLQSLVDQAYSNYEVLVLDDWSQDATYEIASDFAARYPLKIKVFKSTVLPRTWYGKCHAVHQLYKNGTGELFIITDADTCHQPDSIAYMVSSVRYHKSGLVSGYPRQIISTWSEKLLVPSIYIMQLILPFQMVKISSRSAMTFAIGQYICCTKDAFQRIDGMKRVRSEVCEDIKMAKLVKESGLKVTFVDAKDHVACRMYYSFVPAFNGIAKAIFPALQKSYLFSLISAIEIYVSTVQPFFILGLNLIRGVQPNTYLMLSVLVFFLAWALTLWYQRLPFYTPFLFPLLFSIVNVMIVYSAVAMGIGKGIDWKGRQVK